MFQVRDHGGRRNRRRRRARVRTRGREPPFPPPSWPVWRTNSRRTGTSRKNDASSWVRSWGSTRLKLKFGSRTRGRRSRRRPVREIRSRFSWWPRDCTTTRRLHATRTNFRWTHERSHGWDSVVGCLEDVKVFQSLASPWLSMYMNMSMSGCVVRRCSVCNLDILKPVVNLFHEIITKCGLSLSQRVPSLTLNIVFQFSIIILK